MERNKQPVPKLVPNDLLPDFPVPLRKGNAFGTGEITAAKKCEIKKRGKPLYANGFPLSDVIIYEIFTPRLYGLITGAKALEAATPFST